MRYTGGPLNSPGTGLLISNITGSSTIDIESAFGRWNWKKSGALYVYPFQTENVNRITGEDKINLKNKNTTQGNQTHADFLGSSDDFFNMGYNQVFSPWSNPSTYPDNADLSVELLQKDQYNNIHVNFYIQNADNAPPSKPQNLSVEPSVNNHPYATWDANIEPDLIYYNVYKKSSSGWAFLSQTTNNYYEDSDETYCPGGQHCDGDMNIYYRGNSC